ncbi:MAG: amino acid permease [Chloroherpetonaceae bacterium]|nr:amino acid permease [Chloroherpetonaceae bacterium]MCS7211809.1 amino acid permease [Chloroherpetonaceae bacterium]MDW8020007.1 amino acid permease [Chloroherpetonaceae bacterium]
MLNHSLFRKKTIQQIRHDIENGFGDSEPAHSLVKALGVFDLTMLGIAAVVGAGVFSTIGNAAYSGGPAVSLLFVFTAIACGFSVLCYAEFASLIPVSGSAYTYAYAAFGELFAWVIGWGLIMEYVVGNIVVAISWSDYFTGLLAGYGIHIPDYLCMDYFTASEAAAKVEAELAKGVSIDALKNNLDFATALDGYTAWISAPQIGNFRLICDLPAFFINAIITAIVYIGIKESRTTTNIMVFLKVGIVLLVVVLGAFYVNPDNWRPFAPNGLSGVMQGVSAVFFAYIGFDAISTTAEECKDAQRDLPRGMIYSLLICTLLYIAVALVLTGMSNHKLLNVGDPLAFVFGPEGANLQWVSGLVAFSAVIAMASVMLVFQLGQPRIWMAMSRDGLLPKRFAKIHPRFKTPSFSTIVTGLLVGIPSLFANMTVVTDLTSIGTLFAFLLVSSGVMVLEKSEPLIQRKFKIPFVNGKYLVPLIVIAIWCSVAVFNWQGFQAFFTIGQTNESLWTEIGHRIPLTLYAIGTIILAYYCYMREFSLIPALAVLSVGYLMTELGTANWIRFALWVAFGLAIYFLYGYRRSHLRHTLQPAPTPTNSAT